MLLNQNRVLANEPVKLDKEEKPLFPKIKWGQSPTTMYISIEIFNMKMHQIQLSGDGMLIFW